MSSYTSNWPKDQPQDSDVVKFFEDFYDISDTPDAHEKYSKQFTNNAKLIMVSKEANGRSEILEVRRAMWQKVSARKHKPLQIFPFGPHAEDIMLHGTVEYTFKEGGKGGLPWAARAHVVKEDGKVLMDFYQVYLDSALQGRKIEE